MSTVEYLNIHVADFIPSTYWPANSCDLSPMDYYVWSRLESFVYKKKARSLVELALHVHQAWAKLLQGEINRAIENFHPQLRAFKQADGGHIIKFKFVNIHC